MEEPQENLSDVEVIDRLREARQRLTDQIAKVIVGQEEVIDKVLIAIFCQGHSLMIGVPGLAKTLLVKTIARILDLDFRRIQFTPDLMPSDIIGTDVIEENVETGRRQFRFIRGPVFANIILADEINRTPPKTQAALLEAMQEHRVTAGGETFKLEEPFFVLATQNPIEQEGTYPLPEAQLDRFMFNIPLTYPPREGEEEIVKRTTADIHPQLDKVLNAQDVISVQHVVRKIPVSDSMVSYAVKLVAQTRPTDSESPEFVRDWVRWGAGPRASQHLILGAKARSVLRGNYYVAPEDIRGIATRYSATGSSQISRRNPKGSRLTTSSTAWSARQRYQNLDPAASRRKPLPTLTVPVRTQERLGTVSTVSSSFSSSSSSSKCLRGRRLRSEDENDDEKETGAYVHAISIALKKLDRNCARGNVLE